MTKKEFKRERLVFLFQCFLISGITIGLINIFSLIITPDPSFWALQFWLGIIVLFMIVINNNQIYTFVTNIIGGKVPLRSKEAEK